jgi:hypothetical protein
MKCAKCDEDPELRHVLEALQSRFQRATYSALAKYLGRTDYRRILGKQHDQDPLHSWIVNGKTKLPTGYAPSNRHEKLERNSKVVDTGEGLRRLLRSKPVGTGPQKSRNRD